MSKIPPLLSTHLGVHNIILYICVPIMPIKIFLIKKNLGSILKLTPPKRHIASL